MDRAAVLRIFEDYLKEAKPREDFSGLAQMAVPEVLRSSLDVIELVMYLEEALGLEAEIELEALGPKFAGSITFAELAQEVVNYLEAHNE